MTDLLIIAGFAGLLVWLFTRPADPEKRKPCEAHEWKYSGEALSIPEFRECVRCGLRVPRGVEAPQTLQKKVISQSRHDRIRMIGGWGVPLEKDDPLFWFAEETQ